MTQLRAILAALSLAVALVASALAHGYAQAQPRAATPGPVHELVICADTGIETLIVDRDGNPVDPADCLPGLCLDCILAAPLSPLSATTATAARLRAGAPRPAAGRAIHAARIRASRLPRGPPAAAPARD